MMELTYQNQMLLPASYTVLSEEEMTYIDVYKRQMLPIYIGVDGEENQGLCTGSENFWCVNNNSSDADIQATLDFLYWCVTSEAVSYTHLDVYKRQVHRTIPAI